MSRSSSSARFAPLLLLALAATQAQAGKHSCGELGDDGKLRNTCDREVVFAYCGVGPTGNSSLDCQRQKIGVAGVAPGKHLGVIDKQGGYRRVYWQHCDDGSTPIRPRWDGVELVSECRVSARGGVVAPDRARVGATESTTGNPFAREVENPFLREREQARSAGAATGSSEAASPDNPFAKPAVTDNPFAASAPREVVDASVSSPPPADAPGAMTEFLAEREAQRIEAERQAAIEAQRRQAEAERERLAAAERERVAAAERQRQAEAAERRRVAAAERERQEAAESRRRSNSALDAIGAVLQGVVAAKGGSVPSFSSGGGSGGSTSGGGASGGSSYAQSCRSSGGSPSEYTNNLGCRMLSCNFSDRSRNWSQVLAAPPGAGCASLVK